MSRNFYRSILNGLSACHNKGVVHRDIKCESLLIDANWGIRPRVQRSNELVQTFCGSIAYILSMPQRCFWVNHTSANPAMCGAGRWSCTQCLQVDIPLTIDTNIRTMIEDINDGVIILFLFTMSCRDMTEKILYSYPS